MDDTLLYSILSGVGGSNLRAEIKAKLKSIKNDDDAISFVSKLLDKIQGVIEDDPNVKSMHQSCHKSSTISLPNQCVSDLSSWCSRVFLLLKSLKITISEFSRLEALEQIHQKIVFNIILPLISRTQTPSSHLTHLKEAGAEMPSQEIQWQQQLDRICKQSITTLTILIQILSVRTSHKVLSESINSLSQISEKIYNSSSSQSNLNQLFNRTSSSSSSSSPTADQAVSCNDTSTLEVGQLGMALQVSKFFRVTLETVKDYEDDILQKNWSAIVNVCLKLLHLSAPPVISSINFEQTEERFKQQRIRQLQRLRERQQRNQGHSGGSGNNNNNQQQQRQPISDKENQAQVNIPRNDQSLNENEGEDYNFDDDEEEEDGSDEENQIISHDNLELVIICENLQSLENLFSIFTSTLHNVSSLPLSSGITISPSSSPSSSSHAPLSIDQALDEIPSFYPEKQKQLFELRQQNLIWRPSNFPIDPTTLKTWELIEPVTLDLLALLPISEPFLLHKSLPKVLGLILTVAPNMLFPEEEPQRALSLFQSSFQKIIGFLKDIQLRCGTSHLYEQKANIFLANLIKGLKTTFLSVNPVLSKTVAADFYDELLRTLTVTIKGKRFSKARQACISIVLPLFASMKESDFLARAPAFVSEFSVILADPYVLGAVSLGLIASPIDYQLSDRKKKLREEILPVILEDLVEGLKSEEYSESIKKNILQALQMILESEDASNVKPFIRSTKRDSELFDFLTQILSRSLVFKLGGPSMAILLSLIFLFGIEQLKPFIPPFLKSIVSLIREEWPEEEKEDEDEDEDEDEEEEEDEDVDLEPMLLLELFRSLCSFLTRDVSVIQEIEALVPSFFEELLSALILQSSKDIIFDIDDTVRLEAASCLFVLVSSSSFSTLKLSHKARASIALIHLIVKLHDHRVEFSQNGDARAGFSETALNFLLELAEPLISDHVYRAAILPCLKQLKLTLMAQVEQFQAEKKAPESKSRILLERVIAVFSEFW